MVSFICGIYSEANQNLPAHIFPIGIQPFQELSMTKHSIYSTSLQHSSLSNTHHSLDCSVGDSFCAMWYKALIAFMLNKGGFLSAAQKRKRLLWRGTGAFRSFAFLSLHPFNKKTASAESRLLNSSPTLQSHRYVGMCPVPLVPEQKMKALWRSDASSSQVSKLRDLS